MKIKNISQSAFTLIEVLIYMICVVVILATIVTTIVRTYRIYQDIAISPRADQISLSLANKLAHDIRSAHSFNPEESVFGVALGELSLNSTVNDTEVKRFFALEDGRIVYRENEQESEYLTPTDVPVSGLTFTHVITPVSEAIRYNFDITVETRSGVITKSYSGLGILRQSYE